MRRFTAVFKRDKSDSHQSSSSRSHPPSSQSFKKKHLRLPLNISFTSSSPLHTPSSITSTPQLSSASEHGQSSGSSSGSASLSLPAPDEDALARSATRRSWKDWFGAKRSEPPNVPKPTQWDRPMPVWNERPPTLQDPHPSGGGRREVDDTDEGSSEFDEEGSISLSEHPRTVVKGTVSPVRTRQHIEMLIKYSLLPPLTSSPFVQHASHLFPRSCNRPQTLPPALDMRRIALKRLLLRRLEVLSADDETEILPFSLVRVSVVTKSQTLPDCNAIRPPGTTRIFFASPGLRRWISRPCFEDRFAVFLPSQGGVHQGPVVGSLAVAALEYSELLDVMVDPDFDPISPPPDVLDDGTWTPMVEHSSLQTLPVIPPVSPPSTASRHSYISSPSPLRHQHSLEKPALQPTLQTALSTPSSPLPSPISPLSSRSSVSSSPSPILPPPSPILPPPSPILPPPQSVGVPVKRVVRFVEDDNDDIVPLHLLRQKKKREEKAKFLRTEQRRRLMVQEQERRRFEIEALEKERRRLVMENEKKEKEQRLYAEEVAAARLRRESQRAGTIPGMKIDGTTSLVASPSAPSLRETERHRPRESRRYSLMPEPTGSSSSIPRRQASEPASHFYSHETPSYRTSSAGHSPVGSNSGHGHPSRPGSTYSTSSEDGRSNNKRYSGVSSVPSSLARPFIERTSSGWSCSNQSLLDGQPIPPVPPIPEFMNDIVLLPPSAPFMMHQYPRQPRHSSPAPSNSSGSLRGNSASSSSERVNVQRNFSRPLGYSTPPSPGTSPSRKSSRPSHSRHGSGDSSMLISPQSYTQRSQSSSLPRGRSQVQPTQGTQLLQPPNPWTALPAQHGVLPTAMPVSTYSHHTGLGTLTKGSSSKRGS